MQHFRGLQFGLQGAAGIQQIATESTELTDGGKTVVPSISYPEPVDDRGRWSVGCTRKLRG